MSSTGEEGIETLEVDNAQPRAAAHFGWGASHGTAYAGANEMRSENAQGNTVSVTACMRQEKMPNAWRGSGQRSSFR
jgi:hypothetical protein